jgi:hypothetical protein
MDRREEKRNHRVSCTRLSSQYAAKPKPDPPPRDGLADDVTEDNARVLLPDEPPPLTPEAARALLRLLLSIRQ